MIIAVSVIAYLLGANLSLFAVKGIYGLSYLDRHAGRTVFLMVFWPLFSLFLFVCGAWPRKGRR